MQVRDASDWRIYRKNRSNWTHLIDLRNCRTETELIRACASVLHGRDSVMDGMHARPNLDWLNQVVGDWHCEHFSKETCIFVIGADNLFQISSTFALKYLDVFMSGRLTAIRNKSQEFHEAGVAEGYQSFIDEYYGKRVYVFF